MTIKKDLPRFIWLIAILLFLAFILMNSINPHTEPINASNVNSEPLRAYLEGKLGVIEEIRDIAEQENFDDVEWLISISECESNFDPLIRGRIDSRDRGLFQINSFWHPDVSDECAFSIECSTLFTIDAYNNGYQDWWYCNDIIN